MPFDPEALSVLDATITGFTLWHYRTVESAEAILSQPRYFAEAGERMAPGDFIILNAGHGTNPGDGILVVSKVGTVAGAPFVQFRALIVGQT